MNQDERLHAAEELLIRIGWDPEEAHSAASEAIDAGEPIVESLSFKRLAEHLLAQIHDSSWIAACAEDSRTQEGEVIGRLLNSGARAEDLARFARLMQREYLGNLGCLLDGSGIHGTPNVPCQEFRIFSINEDGEPERVIPELHESLSFSDWETEMRLSIEAEESA